MKVEETVLIRVPREAVWRHLAEPARYGGFMDVTRWQPVGRRKHGVGARFDTRMKVGATEVGGEVEVIEIDEGWDVAWTSITGLDHRGRFRIRPQGNGATRVTLRFTYKTPSLLGSGLWALAGYATDALAAPMVTQSVRRSLANLKERIEAEEGVGPPLTSRLLEGAKDLAEAVLIFRSAGLVRPLGLGQLLEVGSLVARWGINPAAGYALSAALYPGEPALLDEAGSLTFGEVEAMSNALARGLNAGGVDTGDTVAVLCRNHRYFVLTAVALWKLGATAVWLNTSFAAPQLADVCEREGARALVYDQEFGDLVEDAGRGRKRFLAWNEGGAHGRVRSLDSLIATHEISELDPPEQSGRTIILTSGTTGRPKGAARSNASSLQPALALLSKIPLRARDRVVMAAPLFHSWGFSHFTLGLLLATTLILQRRFDPEATLAAIERERARVLVAVPVMIQRIMELPRRTRRKYDTSSLEVVALSGSALPAELAERFMDEFGDVIYNLYGSTEAAWATIATPEDLREAPGTAGRAPLRTQVRVYDDLGRQVPAGVPGRIFVGNDSQFEGYTGGGGKPTLDGLLATGDIGHLDSDGRLFVEGREDEMIVSGGENVYPAEVEQLLAAHPGVADVAVVGVPDERFGQALKAFVVRRPRARLTEKVLKGHVRGNLARYKVPQKVEFVRKLPRNATGKVVKRELSETA